ncbi:isochorismatase family protein [Kitasatospora sp. NPDC048239]|uniref:isochorismatase family protein n=1 Tax=Kitasatospora sp. NPDC048239 TaxID=3364046 RepID=UPI00371FBEE4
MGIPKIAPYRMPQRGELPENVAQWSVDPQRAVLLVHDMQKYFLQSFPAGQSPLVELVQNSVLIRQKCSRLGIPVAYTAQPGSMTEEERGLLVDFWGPGMTAEPEQRGIIDELAPEAGDHVFTKWRYSAFHNTDLLQTMRSLGRDQLIICGVYAHLGILMTAFEAFAHDIQPFLVVDSVADFGESQHRMCVEYAAQRCAMAVTTEDVLTGLDAPVGARAAAVAVR